MQIHEFLEEYFKASVNKGIDYPVIANFFDFHKISNQLKTVDPSDIDFGYPIEESSFILSVPEGISHVYTAKLVKLYHEKSSLFEINLLPISEDMHEAVHSKVNSVRQAQINLRKKIKEKEDKLFSSRGINKKRVELKVANQELMSLLVGSSTFTTERLTTEDISTGNFEKDPESYMDYHKLTVSSEIKQWIKASSPVLMIFASSKINYSIRFAIVRQVKDFLIFHFINNLKEQGLKAPNRSGEGFIVRLLIYLQTLLEDKDLQTFDAFSLVGVDQPLFHLLYSLDTGVVLTRVQVHLQSLDADTRSGTFSLLVHVSISKTDFQEQLPGEHEQGELDS